MKTLNFVIPLYNEELRLENTLAELKAGFNFDGIKLSEIIFVDDGSSDKTLQLLNESKESLAQSLNTKVSIISYKPNKGKGYAVRTGMLSSDADYTLFFDADMSTPLNEFKKFIPQIELGIDVIIGTRKNGHSTVIKAQPFYRQILGKGFTILSNIILNTWVTDFTCGFKAFSKQALHNVFSHTRINRWGYDAEIMYLSSNLGYSIKEVPVVWKNDDRSRVNLLYDLPKSLSELLEIRWNTLAGKYDNAIKNSHKTLSFTQVVKVFFFDKLYNG